MRVKNIKKISIILLLIIGLLTLMTTTSKAGLQANRGGNVYKAYYEAYRIKIRNIEEAGGTLGKSATINSTTLRETSESGNGIDVHMILNTEWGSAMLLSSSIYGSRPIRQGETSTGNDSGIYEMAKDNIYVSAVGEIEGSLDRRYYNLYTNWEGKLNGDGWRECANWSNTSLYFPNSLKQPLMRNLFDSSSPGGYNYGRNNDQASRAVVVCGEGL